MFIRRWDTGDGCVDLSHIREGQTIYRPNFLEKDLTGFDFKGTSLIEPRFINTNLTSANLSHCHIEGATFKDAVLIGANLDKSYCVNCTFDDADLSKASFVDAHIVDSYLYTSNLFAGNLTRCTLRETTLRRCCLAGTILTDANIIECVGNGVELLTIAAYPYTITMTVDVLRIGCMAHPYTVWFMMTTNDLYKLDGDKAVGFMMRWKSIITRIYEEHFGGRLC